MEWTFCKPIILQDTITEIEIMMGIKIPQLLKKLIIAYNGGRPKHSTITDKKGNELEVNSLLSYNKDDLNSIFKCISYFSGKYNNNILPFANDSGGNYYCIDLNQNHVVFYDNEEDDCFEITDSLEEFLKLLSAD